ncbi:hypothetical protein SLE2022_037280 [Rubroshorea leprosula]
MRAIPMGIYMMATDLKRCGTEFFLYVLGIVGLVAFAGLRAIWPHSSDYLPTRENFKDSISFLRENKADLTMLRIQASAMNGKQLLFLAESVSGRLKNLHSICYWLKHKYFYLALIQCETKVEELLYLEGCISNGPK